METNNHITVSVCMTTYFHEPYIAQAIESVLSQKVNFSYEIIICDDCSKDGTQDIIKNYAERYNFIKYKFNDENIGLTKNVFQARSLAEGKYVVHLSGDDYWINEKKLQKQVDFLESHPEYFGVATRLEIRDDDSLSAAFLDPPKNKCDRSFGLQDFLKGNSFPTNGFLMKNPLKENYELFSIMPKISQYIDDITDCILVLKCGDIYISSDATVAYRRRIEQKDGKNFNSINKGLDKVKKKIELLNNLYIAFGDEIDLFMRYKVVLGPEMAKNYRFATGREFQSIINTIPEEYRKRGIVLRSIIYIIPKTLEVMARKVRKFLGG